MSDGGGGGDDDGMAIEDADPEKTPPHSPAPAVWPWMLPHTPNGSDTRTPGRGPGGGDTPDWLKAAWNTR